MPWAQAAGVAALGAAGVGAGLWISRRPWWPLACVAAMALVAAFGAGRWAPRLELVVPFAWVMQGRMEYALLAPAAAIALVPPTMRLRVPRQRMFVGVFFALVAGHYSVMPFLWPALARPRLAGLTKQVDRDDVCRQTTAYTCEQFEQRWRFRGVVLRRQVSGLDYVRATNTVPDPNPGLTPAY